MLALNMLIFKHVLRGWLLTIEHLIKVWRIVTMIYI
jgi:hypothetical protein